MMLLGKNGVFYVRYLSNYDDIRIIVEKYDSNNSMICKNEVDRNYMYSLEDILGSNSCFWVESDMKNGVLDNFKIGIDLNGEKMIVVIKFEIRGQAIKNTSIQYSYGTVDGESDYERFFESEIVLSINRNDDMKPFKIEIGANRDQTKNNENKECKSFCREELMSMAEADIDILKYCDSANILLSDEKGLIGQLEQLTKKEFSYDELFRLECRIAEITQKALLSTKRYRNALLKNK